MKKGTVMRRDVSSTVHCSVPLCFSSAKSTRLSFHSFPDDAELRAKWIANIRTKFNVTPQCYVCSKHFVKEDVVVTAGGLHQLRTGAVPLLFHWNGYGIGQPLSVRKRKEKRDQTVGVTDGGVGGVGAVDAMEVHLRQHDHCKAPKPASVDPVLKEKDEMQDVMQATIDQPSKRVYRQHFPFFLHGGTSPSCDSICENYKRDFMLCCLCMLQILLFLLYLFIPDPSVESRLQVKMKSPDSARVIFIKQEEPVDHPHLSTYFHTTFI